MAPKRLERLLSKIMDVSSDYCKESILQDEVEEAIRRLRSGKAIQKTLQQYLPERVVERIITNPEKFKIEGERRYVTVMFADMSGFTAMSEELDPEYVVSIVNSYFTRMLDIMYRYGGTLERFLGDALMILFGSPIGHEDDPQRAALAALNMQGALQDLSSTVEREYGVPLQMSVGINTGNVIACQVGSSLRKGYTVMGDSVNLASRIQYLAKRGEILVGETTYRAIREMFTCTKLKPFSARGKSKPVNVYKLTGTRRKTSGRTAEDRVSRARLIGKQSELKTIRRVLDQATSKDGEGRVLLIAGETGSGKSRLAEALEKRVSTQEAICLKAECVFYGEPIPFLPFSEMLKSYFRIANSDSVKKVKDKVITRIVELNPLLIDEIPHILDIMFAQSEQTGISSSMGGRKQNVFDAVETLFKTIAQDNPLVLLLENSHWMDSSSLELLDYLVQDIKGSRILFCCTYRPEFKWKPGKRCRYETIVLRRLTDKQCRDFIGSLLSTQSIPLDVGALIMSKSDGNPLYIEELVKSMIQTGAIKRTKKEWKFGKEISAVGMPDTIQGIVMARIDRLEEDVRRTVQFASVLGPRFKFALLKSISPIQIDLPHCLSKLSELDIILEEPGDSEKEFVFKHSTVQEVAYNSLLTEHRSKLHEKAGMALEDIYRDRIEEHYGVLAHHYSNSDNTIKAIYYLRKASERNYDLGERDAVLSQSLQSLELCKRLRDKAAQASLLKLIGTVHTDKGEWNTAIDYYKKSLTIYKKLEDVRGVADVFNDLGVVYYQQGDWEGCRVYYGKALSIARKENDIQLIAYLNNNLGIVASIQGEWKKAVRHYKKSISGYQQIGDEHKLGTTYGNLGITYARQKDGKRAAQYYERALEIAAKTADADLGASVYINEVELYLAQSDLEKAKRCCDKAFKMFTRLGDKLGLAECHKYYGTIHAEERDWHAARESFSQSVKISRRYGNLLCLAETYYEWALMIMKQKKSKRAVGLLRKSKDIFTKLSAKEDVKKVNKALARLR
jgi:predicted ATPase/class 3 adenylate cyclase